MSAGSILLAVDWYAQPVQWLAILGGAALGAIGGDLSARLLGRSMTRRKLPPFVLLTARGVGGVAVGLLTAMCLLQGTGWFPFGTGGGPPGGGAPKDSNAPAQPTQPPAPTQPPNDQTTSPTPENSMRVEVLTRTMLENLGHPPSGDEPRVYRLPQSDDPKALHTLREVEDAIKGRPALKYLEIVGPDRTAGWVAPLQDWAEARGLKVGNLPGP